MASGSGWSCAADGRPDKVRHPNTNATVMSLRIVVPRGRKSVCGRPIMRPPDRDVKTKRDYIFHAFGWAFRYDSISCPMLTCV